ncbi:hypothetical protein Bca101_045095 [Brassica carinata]
MPDWMIFPSGRVPPLTITNTAELISVMNRRPPTSDVTLLLTRAKNAAEYQFLCRSTSPLDQKLMWSVKIKMKGQKLHTKKEKWSSSTEVALEMDMLTKPASSARGRNDTGMEIIQLDDDDDMVLVESPPLETISASMAQICSNIPKFFNARRDGNLVSMEDFANGTMDDSCNCCNKAFVVVPDRSESGFRGRVMSAGAFWKHWKMTTRGLLYSKNKLILQLDQPKLSLSSDPITHGGGVVETDKMKGTTRTSTGVQSSGLSLTLACGNAEGGTKEIDGGSVVETSSEGSGTDGAY